MKEKTVRNSQFWLLIPAVLLAVVWTASPLWLSQAANNDDSWASDNFSSGLQASLTGSPINNQQPFGRGEYKTFSNNQSKLEIEVFAVNLPGGTVLTVQLNGQNIGQFTLNSSRSGELELKTERGDTVPVVQSGNQITVLNGATVILSGAFAGNASPSPSGSPRNSPTPRVSPSATPTVNPSVSPIPSSRFYAQLSGAAVNGAEPRGFAEARRRVNGESELKVFVGNVALPQNTVLTVFVGDTNVGQFNLHSDGRGEFERESDNLPNIVAGTAITIRNGAAAILSGVFASGFPSPSPRISPSVNPSVSPTPRVSPSPGVSPTPRVSNYYTARLRGSQVVPAVDTDARGEARILLNQAQTEIQVFASFFNLSSNQTAATINAPALPGSNANAIFDLGTIGGTNGFLPVRTFAVTAEQVAQIRAGLWYVVVSSANNPIGEIRGQIRAHGRRGDFEGDGQSDVSVFRPAEGNWYFLNSSNQQSRIQALGAASDRTVAGDYDGDGVIDAAVYTTINDQGYWKIRRSSDDGITFEQWGLPSDIPVAGDYDGDGRTDLGVFRGSTGIWYVRRSSDGAMATANWGLDGDKPVAGDFDGDGRTDFAVYRPTGGAWFALRSSDSGLFAVQWGVAEDLPQTGDYDGDGETDVAVWRPSTGVWYVRRSIDGEMRARSFGLSGDVPVAGEYDADSLTDIAVFRPSAGSWYIWRSFDDSIVGLQFGASGDKPAAQQ